MLSFASLVFLSPLSLNRRLFTFFSLYTFTSPTHSKVAASIIYAIGIGKCVYICLREEINVMCASFIIFSLNFISASSPHTPKRARCYYLGHEKKTHRTPTPRYLPPLPVSSSFSVFPPRHWCWCLTEKMLLITTQSENRKI